MGVRLLLLLRNKTVSLGSSLEIIYPAYPIWEEGLTSDVYPFLLTGDSDGTVGVCAAVPVGYQIVGVDDANGNLTASSQCVQAGVAGDTTIVVFSVVDLQSPPPHLTAKLKIRHKGKTLNQQNVCCSSHQRHPPRPPGSAELYALASG